PELRGGGSFYRSLIEGFHKVVSKWEEPKRFQLRSLYFMATCSADGTEVQAAVDGLVNEELGEVVAALPWPAAVDAYLYKQLFVLRSGG
ncbi:MAG TPA: hypothetical protein VHV08_13310, partial [Pirellulales bacterium]|nr:hypothetical protein [Pirellulales bacterium]